MTVSERGSDSSAEGADGSEAVRSEPTETTRPASPTRPGMLRRHWLKLVISLVLGGGIAWAMSRGGLPLVPPRANFRAMSDWAIPVYMVLLAITHFLRAARWRHLLKPLGEVSFRNVLSVSFVSFAIILMSPLRSGEVARPYLITRRSNIRMWEATGTIGAERVIDGLCLSVILAVALWLSVPLSPLPNRVGDLQVPVSAVPGAAYGALLLFTSAFAMMAAFYWWRDFARRLTLRIVGVVSKRLANFFADGVERVARGLSFLPNRKQLVPFLGETFAYWGINALGIWVLAVGCGLPEVSPLHACVAMGCVGIGILVPSGPGYFGAFQLSAFMALAMYFPEEVLIGSGSAFVFVLYVTQVGWHLVAAVIGLLLANLAEPTRTS